MHLQVFIIVIIVISYIVKELQLRASAYKKVVVESLISKKIYKLFFPEDDTIEIHLYNFEKLRHKSCTIPHSHSQPTFFINSPIGRPLEIICR